MRILVVTSEVTFVPFNYNGFLETLFSDLSTEQDLNLELIILKNNSFLMSLKGVFLALIGARHIGYHLIKNSFSARFKDRTFLTKKYSVKIHIFNNPNSPDFHQFVKKNETDLIINARTRFIYKNKILKLPKIASLNIHHGLLPDYRGVMCDLYAINEDRPTGFSIHVMEKKIDNGAIIRRVQTSIKGDPLRSNFANLVFHSSKLEGHEMANIVKNIKKNHSLTIERDNISTSPVYTKNPDIFTIRKILQKGFEL